DSSMNYLDKFGYSYGYRPSENPQEVFFAEGMAFAVKREVVNRIGILDDYYFMEYDDMDYSWRARLAGYRVYFLPSAIVYHARGGTVGRTYFERVKNLKWYTRNHLVTIIKNYEIRNLIKILPAVLIIETTKILYILFIKKNVKLSFAAMFGISEIIRDWKLIYVKRMNVKKVRRVPDKTILKQMHPFVPRLFYSFLVEQSKGKRFISDASPPKTDP
ncbi:glycosyltransferase, partial [Candidatus Bathyarchaeota archaeon]|nr:glycosyltransferase [Candidatus Bathyarchaeota archaeon]